MRPASPGDEVKADETLVRRTLAGDNGAFDELVERYQLRIFNLALRVTGSSQDARDACQNAFLKVYQNLARFDPAYKFFSWIYRIASNEAIDIVNRRRRTVPLALEAPDRSAGAHRRAASKQSAEVLREELDRLPPEQRITVILRHLHGLTYREMSEILEIPENKVKSRLFSARSKLRRRLAARGLQPDV